MVQWLKYHECRWPIHWQRSQHITVGIPIVVRRQLYGCLPSLMETPTLIRWDVLIKVDPRFFLAMWWSVRDIPKEIWLWCHIDFDICIVTCNYCSVQSCVKDEGIFSQWFLMMQLLLYGFNNTLRPRQNGRHFTDDTFNHIFFNENVRISIKISLKYVPKGPIINIPALVQIMACRRIGGKPLS